MSTENKEDQALDQNNITDSSNTYQKSITKDAEGNILEPYKDPQNDKQYASTPKTTTDTTKSNTGTGLEAALGTEYSWETKAKDRASLDYESQVLQTKKDYLTNRQELESQGQQMQEQAAMQKYSQNQSNEKAGWTGGYVLDTERQMAYLKQTIQSQMYGAMELQKYGYDTALAAARLAYDTQKYDLALEYYNTALQVAVTEAEMTGYYLSPEAKEMLNQYSIASTKLNNGEGSEREEAILKSVNDWFESNGISKEGRITTAQLLQEMSASKQIFENYDMDAIDQKTYTIDKDSAFKLDANGEWTMNKDGTADTFSWNDMSAEEILAYIKTSDLARDQYYSRLDRTVNELETGFTDWCVSNGYANKDEEGKITGFSPDDYNSIFKNYLASKGENLLQSELDKFKNSKPEDINDLLINWKCDLKLPDGTEIILSLEPAKGVKVGEELLTKEGFVRDYQGYVVTEGEGDNAQSYLKPCKDIEILHTVIKSNPELNAILELSQLDITSGSFEDELHEIFSSISTGATVTGATVGSFFGPLGTLAGGAIGAGASSLVENFVDIGGNYETSQYYKQQVEDLTKVINKFEECLGEENLKLLEDANKKYNELSDRDRSLLPANEQETLKFAHTLISGLENYKSALEYAEDRDSNMFDNPWDYIGDNWEADFEDIWSDGYQLGDIIDSGVTAVVDTLETVGAVVVGGVNWVWKGIKKLKFW